MIAEVAIVAAAVVACVYLQGRSESERWQGIRRIEDAEKALTERLAAVDSVTARLSSLESRADDAVMLATKTNRRLDALEMQKGGMR